MRRILTIAAAAAVVLGLTSCTIDEGGDAQGAEIGRQQSTYESLVDGQPAGSMGYSPTRETINFWIDTWDEPGKLAYVYLQSADGTLLGYYVLKGLPVSYCASLTPTYRRLSPGATGGGLIAPAPAMDGVYYSGGQCDTYYGQDATTGAYVEYTAGLGINVLLYDAPLARQDVEPLGPTDVDDVS